MSDPVEATPKRSADCFLDVKPRPPDDALGRVGEARSAVGEWDEGGRGNMFLEDVFQEDSDFNTQRVWTWLWRKLTFRSSSLPFI